MDFESSQITGSREAETLLDTGAGLDCLSTGLLKEWGMEYDSTGKKIQLRAFDGKRSETVGKVHLNLVLMKERIPMIFDVINAERKIAIIANPSIEALDLRLRRGKFYTNKGHLVGRPTRFRLSARGLAVVNEEDEDNFSSPIEVASGLDETSQSSDKIEVAELKFVDKVNSIVKTADIDDSDRRWLRDLLVKFETAFSDGKSIGLLPSCYTYEQSFSSGPPSAKLYELTEEKTRIIADEVMKMVKMGVLVHDPEIKIVTSQFLVVKKPKGGWRSVIDLRNVNAVTVASNRPLPKIETILRKLSGKPWYVSADVSKAYWNISLPESQQIYYTTVDPSTSKVYKYCRLPMGHVNAAQAFQGYMESIFGGLKCPSAIGLYIDDINLGFANKSDAKAGLQEFLSVVSKCGLRLNLDKCKFLCRKINVFGYEVSEAGVRAEPARVEKLAMVPFPASKRELLSFLASCNYFRDTVPKFSQLAAGLYELTAESTDFVITGAHREQFKNLKAALCESVLLEPIKSDETFVVESDASITGTSGVLKQLSSTGQERIVAVTSSGLVGSQKLWSIACLELLGVFRAVHKFEKFLDGKSFIIRTDNTAVMYTLGANIEKVEISKRSPASRALLYLSQFNYRVEHVKGESEKWRLTDLLSRITRNDPNWTINLTGNSKKPLMSLRFTSDGEVIEKNVSALDVAELVKPVEVSPLVEKVKLAQLTSRWVETKRLNPGRLVWEDNVLYLPESSSKFGKLLLVVPPHIARSFIVELHLPKHLSARQMLYDLQNFGFHVHRAVEICAQVAQSCDICASARSRTLPKVTSETLMDPKMPWDICAVDLMHIGRDQAVLVTVDLFSKFTILTLLPDQSAKSVSNAIFNVLCTMGLPNTLLSDNGKNIKNDRLGRMLEVAGVCYRNSSPYNSRGNAVCERKIRDVQDMCRIHQPNMDELRQFLSAAMYVMNHRKTTEKFTPYECFFSRSSLVGGLPVLSDNKKSNLSRGLKILFEEAEKIRDEVVKKNARKRELLGKAAQTPLFRRGDIVRIKQVALNNTAKKFWKPFTSKRFEVLSCNRFTKTCLLQEIGHDERVQPARLVRSCRFLLKVKSTTEEELRKEEDDCIPVPGWRLSAESADTKSEVNLDKVNPRAPGVEEFEDKIQNDENKVTIEDDKRTKGTHWGRPEQRVKVESGDDHKNSTADNNEVKNRLPRRHQMTTRSQKAKM